MGVEKKIGDDVFSVEPMLGMRSFVLQPRIAPVIAEVGALLFGTVRQVAAGLEPPAEKAGEKAKTVELADLDLEMLLRADLDLDRIADAIGRCFSKLPPAELESIVRELLAGARMNGVELFTPAGNPFDILLRGKTLVVWSLLWFALQVNYPDFFGRLGEKSAPAPASRSEASTTTPKPGPAGGS